jgi:hypothetical protein
VHEAREGSVEFRFYRYEKGHWVRRKTVPAAITMYRGESRITARTVLRGKGKWTVVAYHSDADHAGTVSANAHVTVR